ncbi:MAG: pentapeptide repeat-containing protein [Chloroflexi bacterium]|nr:pentapeptide repeat-containing protein [Chloroflexota bacterium]
MSNPEHVAKLREGAAAWNLWRKDNPDIKPDLSGADLSYANLDNADLSYANLYNADLTGANLSYANLDNANLTGANLYNADLSYANLYNADLSYANLHNADLSYAKLHNADLSYAKLHNADLEGANLSGANLSGVGGIHTAAEFLTRFDTVANGIVVYKVIGNTYNAAPESWEIKEGSYIAEVPNALRTNECGCGVNFGTRKWCEEEFSTNIKNETSVMWECLIDWIDLADVVVPYDTKGKARCARLKLIAPVKPNQGE